MLSQIKHVMQDSNKPSAIIVGAGPGGLASAMLLAYSGVDVTVIEKAEKVGGRTIKDGLQWILDWCWEEDGHIRGVAVKS